MSVPLSVNGRPVYVPGGGRALGPDPEPPGPPPLPTISIADASPNPATEGTDESVTFRVSISFVAEDDVTFSWTTQDGTAEAGTNYTAASGTGTITQGDTFVDLGPIAILDPAGEHGTTAFSVVISNAQLLGFGLTISDNTGICTILDDEATSPMSAGLHPRLGWVLDGTYPDVMTRAALRTKIQTYYGASGGSTEIGANAFQQILTFADANFNKTTKTDAQYLGPMYAMIALLADGWSDSGFTFGHTASEYGDECARLCQVFLDSVSVLTTVRGEVSVGATTIPVNSISGLPLQGRLVVNGSQMVMYTGLTGGESPTINGVPPSGVGSVVATIPVDAPVKSGVDTYMGDGGFHYNLPVFLYDWGFSFLTTAQRVELAAGLATQVTIYSSQWSADSSKMTTCQMAAAAAMAGDGYQDAWSEARLAEFATRIVSPTGVIGQESAAVNSGDGEPLGSGLQSGLNYSNYQWQYWVLHTECVRTAYGVSRETWYAGSDYDAVASAVHWWTYLLAPHARPHSSFPGGFEWSISRSNYSNGFSLADSPAEQIPLLFAGIYQDKFPDSASLAQWYARRRIRSLRPDSRERIGRSWVFRLLFEDPAVAEASPADLELPTQQWFGDGRFEARSGWDNINDDWAARWYFARYATVMDGRAPCHLNGHFEIQYKGPALVIRAPGGHYDVHHGGFNNLTFRDTEFSPPFLAPESGSNHRFDRYMAGRQWSFQQPQAVNRGNDIYPGSPAEYLGEVRRRAMPGLSYQFADLSKWHPHADKPTSLTSSGNPAICQIYHRQIVLFQPLVLGDPLTIVVVDRYVLEESATTRCATFAWNPSGDDITIDGDEDTDLEWYGTNHGIWRYTNASRVVAVNTRTLGGSSACNNVSALTIIRPTTRTLVKYGGQREDGVVYTTGASDGGYSPISVNNSCEGMDYYGQRWPSQMNDEVWRTHIGKYGIIVFPSTPQLAGDMLTVTEVIPTAVGAPATCEALTNTTNCEGVAVLRAGDQKILVAGVSGDAATCAFTVPTAGLYRVLRTNQTADPTITVSAGSASNKAWDAPSKSVAFDLETTANNAVVELE